MMSVATCDHVDGISTSFISNTTDPSGLVIFELRFSHVMLLYGLPGVVYFLSTFSPDFFATFSPFITKYCIGDTK